MNQKTINEIKDRAVKSAKQTLCTDILRLANMQTRKRGNQVYAVCYNCGKSGNLKTDKFSVNTDENLYHCFGCGVGGGAPKLYSSLFNTSYMEACLYLAHQNKDISDEEYNSIAHNYTGLKKLNNDGKIFKKMEEKSSDEVELKAPLEVVDLVYRHLLSLPEFALDTTDKNYLISRGLSEEEIKDVGFFSYKKNFSIDKLIDNIRKTVPSFTYNHLRGVAGFFFQYTNKEKTKGVWKFKSPYFDSVGIPLRNADGLISALQMRYCGKKKTDNKYFYISSKNISVKNEVVAFGAGCGSPVATIYPDNITNSTFCIGEGFFKMREVSKEGSVCFSIQGVNSYRYIADEVKTCLSSDMLGKKLANSNMGTVKVRFMIIFDSDMFQKIQVLSAGIKLAEYLKENFGTDREVVFLVWDENLGKGFDDMKFHCIDNNISYYDYMKTIDSNEFIALAKESIKEADEEYFSLYPDSFSRNSTKHRTTSEWGLFFHKYLYEHKIKPY